MKYSRRHTRITYEGISFMSVLAFIILGSIIRQINLLVLLSGLMIAPFFFNWRISMKLLERVRARRRMPEFVHAGEPFAIRWQIHNDRARIPSWGLRVTDQLSRLKKETAIVEQVSVMVPPVPPRRMVEVSYRCLLPERGVYECGPADVSSAFPVGLIRSKIKLRDKESLVVAPRQGRLTRSWVQLMNSRQAGETQKQRQRSVNDGEFYAIRPWTSGDNPRHVHWRSSARHGELMVRQYEQNTDKQLVLVLDLFASSLPAAEIESALSFATTVLHRFSQGRSQSAVGIFGDRQLMCAKVSRKNMPEVMETLALVQPAEDNGLSDGIGPLLDAGGRRRLLIVISTRSRAAATSLPGLRDFGGAWIDISNGDLTQYFLPATDKTREFVQKAVGTGEALP